LGTALSTSLMEDEKILSDTSSVWNVQLNDNDDWHRSMHQRDAQTQTDSCYCSDEIEMILQKLTVIERSLQRPWWQRIFG